MVWADLIARKGVVFKTADPREADPKDLLPAERQALGPAVDSRVKEYAAGRVCARKALAELGCPELPILRSNDRSPIWPEGYVGSIAHTKDHCVAAVCEKGNIVSIGLDVEQAIPMKERVAEMVMSEKERETCQSLADEKRSFAEWAKVFFAAKEAFYKAQYPITKHYLGFSAAEVSSIEEDGHLELTLVKDAEPFVWGTPFVGRYAFDERWVKCAFVVDV